MVVSVKRMLKVKHMIKLSEVNESITSVSIRKSNLEMLLFLSKYLAFL